MFQEALQFQSANVFCYIKQTAIRVIGQMLPPLTWQIFQIVVDYFSLLVSTCVLNHSHAHWLLNDVLHFAIP